MLLNYFNNTGFKNLFLGSRFVFEDTIPKRFETRAPKVIESQKSGNPISHAEAEDRAKKTVLEETSQACSIISASLEKLDDNAIGRIVQSCDDLQGIKKTDAEIGMIIDEILGPQEKDDRSEREFIKEIIEMAGKNDKLRKILSDSRAGAMEIINGIEDPEKRQGRLNILNAIHRTVIQGTVALHCYDWAVNKILGKLGYIPWAIHNKHNQFKKLYRKDTKGDYLPIPESESREYFAGKEQMDDLAPGDHLFISLYALNITRKRKWEADKRAMLAKNPNTKIRPFHPHGDSWQNHSCLFLGWEDKKNRIAYTASYPGTSSVTGKKMPPRISISDFNQTPILWLAKPILESELVAMREKKYKKKS